MASLLVVEDEAVLGKNIKRTLERLGHTVHLAGTGAEGLRLFSENPPQLTLLDLRLPDADGLDLLRQIRAEQPEANVLIMTAFATVEDAVQAIKLGARDYLQKPLNLDDLRHAVTRVLEEVRLQYEVSYYRGRESKGAVAERLLGRCAAMEDLRGKIRRLCALPASAAPPTVLITGGTGTGKGLVARVLHYNGLRSDCPFIEVNCAALPENLVEAELFGHERGAFTDAKAAKVGLFQAADKGTLFLDEIGCVPPAVQVKILKAIEERTVRPIGGRAERPIDIQIIAATNSNLEQMVADGTFREDLYYRLRVAPLVMPSLHERDDDILLLADIFLEELLRSYRMPKKTLSEDARAAMLRYPWPGNVRELRNTLDRAVLFSDGDVIDANALSLPVVAPKPVKLALQAAGALEVELPDEGVDYEDIERALIVAALRKSGGSQTAAARLLRISRDTLRYRMEKFGIETKA